MKRYEKLFLEKEKQRLAILAVATNDLLERQDYESQMDKIILKEHWLDISNEFRGIAKDLRDTVKPYKSFFYVFREFYRPLQRGLRNVFLGLYFVNAVVLGALIYLLGVFTPPSVFLYAAAVFMLPSSRAVSTPFYYSSVRRSLAHVLLLESLTLAGSAFSLVWGVIQIASWPFFLLRIPIRGIITLVQGTPKIEDNKGISRLLMRYQNESPKTDRDKKVFTDALLYKLLKGRRWGQKTNIPLEKTGDLMKKGRYSRFFTRHHPSYVMGLFRRAVSGDVNEKMIPSRGRSYNGLLPRSQHRRSQSASPRISRDS